MSAATTDYGDPDVIRHVVFFRCREREDLERVYEGLSLLSQIPHCRNFEIGRNLRADTISEDVPDFVVYGEFDSQEQLDAYKSHPAYTRSISIVRPLRDMRIAADFLSSES